ncbi:ROK family protein [Curtobacterium ammoniigenes]|uniref:ROK family protein n=1 Tax=Curtobacterium ammoniigenes TaxID=395387 RepID=UPI0012EE0C17|nr:ROK family protein [Curtobacterium ammoniigenes]
MNAKLVLAALRSGGPLTGPEIAERLGVTKPTAAAALRLLAGSGLVESSGVRAGQVGRSPELWQVNAAAGTALAVDIGPRSVTAVRAAIDGRVVARGSSAITGDSVEAVLAALDAAIDGAFSPGAPTWTVVGVPGAVDPVTFRVSLAPNLPALAEQQFTDGLRARFVDSLEVQKDVYLAARGELEARRNESGDFLLVTVGHGIGAAQVRNGAPIVGASGFAGEIGYLPLHAHSDGREPAIDSRTAPLERAAAEEQLLRSAQDAGVAVATIDALFAAAATDDAARAIVRAEASLLAFGLATVVLTTNPERILLSGSVAIAGGAAFCAVVEQALGGRLPFPAPPIALARTGPEGTLAGGLSVAIERGWEVLARRID